MIKNKKGLSAIITTLLVVLLVLVAVGIVWAVVRKVVTSGTESVEWTTKCLNVDVSATAVLCSAGTCNVTLERTGSETDEIGGVKLVFRDSVNSASSSAIDESGDVELLVGKKVLNVATGLTAPDSVEVTAYFLDSSGNEHLCSTTTKEF